VWGTHILEKSCSKYSSSVEKKVRVLIKQAIKKPVFNIKIKK